MIIKVYIVVLEIRERVYFILIEILSKIKIPKKKIFLPIRRKVINFPVKGLGKKLMSQ